MELDLLRQKNRNPNNYQTNDSVNLEQEILLGFPLPLNIGIYNDSGLCSYLRLSLGDCESGVYFITHLVASRYYGNPFTSSSLLKKVINILFEESCKIQSLVFDNNKLAFAVLKRVARQLNKNIEDCLFPAENGLILVEIGNVKS